MVEILLVVLVADLLAILHPLVPRREGIGPPVDKQLEAIMREPRRIALGGSGGARVSTSFPYLYLRVFYYRRDYVTAIRFGLEDHDVWLRMLRDDHRLTYGYGHRHTGA